MTEALLALIASLTATLVWVVKRLGSQNGELIKSLTKAVDSFREFEKSEDQIHRDIIETQKAIASTQREILRAIERLADKLEAQ